MKKNYKNLIFPALALVVFIPLVSMAASDNTSLVEKNKKSIQYRQSSVENFNHSSADKENVLLERDNRRLENRANHTEMMNVLEAGDYDAWLEFVKDRDCPMSSQINEENFSEFVEMHKLKVKNREGNSLEKNKVNSKGGRR